MISGVATAVKGRSPTTRVIGVEPEGADAMSRSLVEGEPVTLDRIDTIADGLAAPFAGCHTFEHVRRHVDTVVRVPDEAIIAGGSLRCERRKRRTRRPACPLVRPDGPRAGSVDGGGRGALRSARL